ncbi:Por secretion system C-terminal sorting domain-containing protein [Reichenbachiella agariperforans]|uniref:Por secretion system C-terminal sorting domain-containing protein n=2 Tax=Reichenbachiella agariperforans TaxID=156994 RepID=A0A1M6JFS5_REIAG|nr:Por secretion system C-terminal sorting domain-containing protein [Reichenbachiella agariperforans]
MEPKYKNNPVKALQFVKKNMTPIHLAHHMKQFLLASILCITTASLLAQTGPAGLGTTDGSSTLELWLRADQGISTIDNKVQTWSDWSGNGRDMTQTNATRRPSFNTAAVDINEHPTVDFVASSNSYMQGASTQDFFGLSGDDPTQTGDVFVIFKQPSTNSGYVMQFPRTTGNASFFTLLSNGGDGTPADNNKLNDVQVFVRNSAGGFDVQSSHNDPTQDNIFTVNNFHLARMGFDPSTNDFWLYNNDELINSETTANTISYDGETGNGPSRLGSSGSGSYYDGEIAEVFLFSERLDDTKYIIVQNYLNARYGLATANDFYAGDLEVNSEHTYGVFGIGKATGATALSTSTSEGLQLTANSGLDDGDYVFAGHKTINNALLESDIAGIGGASPARMQRVWYIDQTDTGTPLTVDITFNLDEAGIPDVALANASNYKLISRSTANSGNWSDAGGTVSIDDVNNTISFSGVTLTDDFYTVATEDNTLSPLGDVQQTWYSFQTGAWGDPNSWTLDGATTPLFDNPNNEVPGSADKVIITAGRTISMYQQDGSTILDNVSVQSLALRSSGRLNLLTSTGNNFTTISGAGTLSLQGSPNVDNSAFLENLPEGDYSAFADQLLGGTITLNTASTGIPFLLNQDLSTGIITDPNGAVSRSLTINMDNSTDLVILQRDLYLTRNLNLTQGQLQIHRNNGETYTDVSFSDANLTIDVVNNVSIAASASLTTGDANQRHQFNSYGNFSINGPANFTQRTSANLTSTATDGIVDLNFLNTEKDQLLTCNAIANFYRIKIDKESAAHTLSITASADGNFNLYGRANYSVDSDLSYGGTNNNAFALVTGTAKLGSNVNFTLNQGGNYSISSSAQLWVDGAEIIKTSGSALVPYGQFKISAGIAEFLVQSGITIRDAGGIEVTGGTLYANQIRTSIQASDDIGSYTQSGGHVYVNGGSGTGPSGTFGGGTQPDYFVFCLPEAANVFRMSGGTLEIQRSNYNTTSSTGTANDEDATDDLGGGIFINSAPQNIEVTGGTVIMNMDNTVPFKVVSKAPFYDVIMTNSGGGAINDADGNTTVNVKTTDDNIVFLAGGQSGDGSGADVIMQAQPLVVLNDLTIGDGTNPVRFDHLGQDVTIGRNFTISENAEYYFGVGLLPIDLPGGNASVPASHQNTTTFNSSISGSLVVSNLIDDGEPNNEQLFHNVVINKEEDAVLTLVAPNKVSGNLNAFRIPELGSIRVESGTFSQGIQSMRFYGDVYNASTLGVFESGVTPNNALLKFRANDFTINTEPGAVFGNFRLNSGTGIVTLDNDVTIKRLQYQYGRLNIGSNKLIVEELDLAVSTNQADYSSCAGCLSVEDMIITNGKASDGGLSLRITEVANPAGAVGNNINGNATLDALDDDDFLFPLGIGTSGDASSKYTPVLLSLSSIGDLGEDGEAYITINPVQGELKTTDISTGEGLTYYWRIRTEGFDAAPTLDYVQFFGNNDDDPSAGANLASYVSGKVEDGGDYTRSSETHTVVTPSNPAFENTDYSILFDGDGSGFTLTNTNFTAGDAARFIGSPDIFYTKLNSRRNWNDQTKWTHNADGSGGGNNGYPQAGDIAVIQSYGNANQNHWVNANVDIEIAELRYDASAGGYPPRLWVTKNDADLNLGLVSGEGDLYLEVTAANSPQFTGETDLGTWSDEPNSSFTYQVTSNNNTVNMMSNVEVYPRLRIEAEGGTNRVLQTSIPITIKQDVRIDRGSNWRLNHDTHIQGDLRISWQDNSGCSVEIGDDREVTITLDSDLKLENGNGSGAASFTVENNNLNSYRHTILLAGNVEIETGLTGSSSLNLYNGTGTNNNAILEFTGSESKTLINNSSASVTPNLYRMVMNKGTDNTSSFAVNNTVTFPLPSEIGEQPIEIVNGTLILDDSGIDITLTDASTGDFNLPNLSNPDASSGSGGLEIKNGLLKIEGDDTGLILDGSLILSGGSLDMNTGVGNGNNYIEYSASNNASIEVNNAASTLQVGSQIRRGFFSEAGILDLTITDGTVSIGAGTKGDYRRGMLEVINTGSNLTFTGGQLIFVNQNGATANSALKASLLLEPDTYDLTGSTILIDLLENTNSNFSINSNIPLYNLTLQSTIGSESEVIQLKTRDLTIEGDLTLSSDVEFRSNNLDLTLYSNMTINDNAVYTAGINKTTFDVDAGTVTLGGTNSSTIEFYDFEKTGTGTLSLETSIEISGATFDLSEGTLADNDNTIDFIGQSMVNNGIHTSNSNLVDSGIRFKRTNSEQTLSTSGEGVFGNLTISNENGVALPDANQDFQINNNLTLDEGIFDIGPALLLFTSTGTITNGEGNGASLLDFGEQNQIQTNSSIIDFGMEKEFAANSTTNFVFPVGEGNRYTPVIVDFAGGNSGSTLGKLRIRPRNAVAPIMLSEEQSIQDAILQYHWLINATDLTDFNANIIASYDDDVIGTDSEDTYRGARAIFTDPNLAVQNPFPDSDGDGMIESDPDPDDNVDDALNTITFPIATETDFSGEYFAGDPATIPDAFEALIFDANGATSGNHNVAENYFYDQNSDGIYNGTDVRQTDLNAVIGGAIEIASGKTLVLNTNNISFSRLILPVDGILEIDGTNGHILGQVSGSGTIRINSDGTTAALPAGDYLNFFDCTGGALEYGGSGDYTIMVETNEVRQLTLNGSGTKTFVSNSDINICENLIVNEGILNLADDKEFTVGEDFILNDGTVNMASDAVFEVNGDVNLVAGTLTTANDSYFDLYGDLSQSTTNITTSTGGTSTVSFLGSTTQTITGDFSIFNVVINNSAAGNAIVLTGGTTLQINGNLSLVDGIIVTDNTVFKSGVFSIDNILSFSTSATYTGGSAISHVDGVVKKINLLANSSFTFPTGDNGIFAPTVVNEDATGGSDWTARYVNIDPTGFLSNNVSNIGTTEVSINEFWVVHSSAVQSATIGMTYGPQSDVLIPTETTVVSILDNIGGGNGVDNDDTWADMGRGGLSSGASTSAGTITANTKNNTSLSFYTLGGQTADALPVELISFDAELITKSVKINWTTASELNNDRFEIERSADGESFEYIGQVAGNGTINEEIQYSYIDEQPYFGVAYYRLIQIDYDGTETIYGPVKIDNDQFKQGIDVVLYPNPTPSDQINIRLNSGDENSKIAITIFNTTGHMVYQQIYDAQLGQQNIEIKPHGHLETGLYHVRVQQKNQQVMKKLIVK